MQGATSKEVPSRRGARSTPRVVAVLSNERRRVRQAKSGFTTAQVIDPPLLDEVNASARGRAEKAHHVSTKTLWRDPNEERTARRAPWPQVAPLVLNSSAPGSDPIRLAGTVTRRLGARSNADVQANVYLYTAHLPIFHWKHRDA